MIYDLALIGTGIAGVSFLYDLALNNIKLSVFAVDSGRPPLKRRGQLRAYYGAFLNTDGKIYLDKNKELENILTKENYSSLYEKTKDFYKVEMGGTLFDNKKPTDEMLSLFKNNKYKFTHHKYFQTYPSNFHTLSRKTSQLLMDYPSFDFLFDEEVVDIEYDGTVYTLFFLDEERDPVQAKQIVINTGRAGWFQGFSWLKKFDQIKKNDIASFGCKIEVADDLVSNLNGSHFSLDKGDIQLGPFYSSGKIIPQDFDDLATACVRTNENRYKSTNTSFELLVDQKFENRGIEEANRIVNLLYILANERIVRDKFSTVLNKKSKLLGMVDAYCVNSKCTDSWFVNALKDISNIFPNIQDKSYIYTPVLCTNSYDLKLSSSLECDIKGLYVIGEAVGSKIGGIFNSTLTGFTLANNF